MLDRTLSASDKPMVGSIERIQQEIADLEKKVSVLAESLYNAYSSYLEVLGVAVQRQLILASYHVCTQGYPEQFLRLSYQQRQELQQTLQRLARQIQEELLAQLHVPIPIDQLEMNSLSELESDPFSLPEVDSSAIESAQPLPAGQAASQSLMPADLAYWQESLETMILQELKTVSHAANRLLQQENILPKHLPEPVLETAAKAEMAEMGGSTPNLLNLLVEKVDPNEEGKAATDDSKGHRVMHIIAIHLRLAEIEFADANVNMARTKIRGFLSQLKNLGREYQKKQRERSIAEAQAAWRSSWVEEM